MAQGQGAMRQLPPYVPWRTFKNFIDGLRSNMPTRIDKSLMGSMSGATQGQLISALRFMGLTADNGSPTPRLREFVTADGEDRAQKLSDMLFDAYRTILDAAVDPGEPDFNFLDNGTYRQLSDAFAATGATGDTLRKCIAFFLQLARDADLEFSPHFRLRGRRGGLLRRRRALDGSDEERAERKIRFELLMEKFPAFDPEWSREIQAKWLDAFERIQSATQSEMTDREAFPLARRSQGAS